MTDLGLPELRAIAEAATPGPWEAALAHRWDDNHEREDYRSLVYVRGERDPLMPGGGEHGDDGMCREDARHMATFDPPTVLALLDRLEAAEAKVTSLCARCGKPAEGFATINDDRFCHGETSPTCYELAQWELFILSPELSNWRFAEDSPDASGGDV